MKKDNWLDKRMAKAMIREVIQEFLSPYVFVNAFVNGCDMEFTKCEEMISKAREQEKILFDGDRFAVISLDGFER